ncbi:MAG: transcription factor [Promethearchaeota archaeon]
MTEIGTSQQLHQEQLDPCLIEILREIGGEDCVNVALELKNIESDEITDEELAERSGIKLNIVRRMLYILEDNKLSIFKKVRDKKSGWFIYYWRDNFDNLRNFIREKQQLVLEKLSVRLEYEDSNVFYICENPECNQIFTFDEATDVDFKCTKCESTLTYNDNEDVKEFLRQKIAILRENIKNLSG